MDYRFRIERSGDQWELYERRPTRGFLRREEWVRIASSAFRENLEDHMKAIVEGEKKVAPTYYNRRGEVASDF